MIPADLFQETYLALLTNKARSGLTVLGIVIGIGSVIAMVSIGQGATGSIESSIQSMGSNLLMITPGAQRSMGYQVRSERGSSQTLTSNDAEAIEQEIPYIEAVAPELSGRYQVTAKGTNTNTQIDGVTSAYASVRNVQVSQGEFISDQNEANASKVAVLGPTAWGDLFGTSTDPVGQTIRIKSMEFKVIGVTEAKGGTGFSNQDDIIYIPLSTAQRFLTGKNYVSTINVQVSDQKLMDSVQEQITSLLLERHEVSTADFSIMNQADIVESASSISDTLTLLLGSIAGISLLVGGIGIMNMMLTTVTERTREIGLRKAIGAKKKDISMQFLAEAVMLTVVGGIIGILTGLLVSALISHFGVMTTKVSSFSVLLAFGVSAAIGIVFGYYPARRAAALNPITALRYE